jgi:uncharacterized repeat protein (TIGR01451 family)
MKNQTPGRKGRSVFRGWKAAALGVATLAVAGPALGVGGPVILGGDDLQDHGSFDGVANQNLEGWLYIQKSLENISPKVGRANDGTVAALGAADAPAATSSDCGGAIGHAAAKAGLGVTYYDTPAGITGFFTQLGAGTATPRIIWIAGVGTGNCMDPDEIAAVTTNASAIDGFVNQGGGLMSHGDASVYGTPLSPGWLNALIPGIEAVGAGSSGDLELTPAGLAAFPGLTNADVNAGPWHNHFRGDFGGLNVLVQTNVDNVEIPKGSAVVLGGGQVSLTLKPADLAITKTGPATADLNGAITYTLTVTNAGTNPAPGVKVTDALPAGLTFVSATPSQGTCTGAATVTCALGDMAPGASATISLQATATAVGVVTNTATVESSVPDPNAINDTGSAATTVVAPAVVTGTARAALGLAVTGPKRATAGTVVVYRLKVTNTSGQTATSVTLRNPIPAGFVIAQRTMGARLAKATNTWSFGDLAAGTSTTVTVKLRVDRAARGSKCVTGRATAANADPADGRSCTRILRVAGVTRVPVTG